MEKLLVGSYNHSKIEFYKDLLSTQTIQVVSPTELGIDINIKEDLFDIKGNAIKKARVFALESGLPSLSDDTGIFIPVLNNEPGVAARRWAGQLPENTSDIDWLEYFHKKIDKLEGKDLTCYKHQVISISLPNGKHFETEFKRYGNLSKTKRKTGFIAGAPFSAHFYLDKFKKMESDLSDIEMNYYTKRVKRGVLTILHDLL
jgi:XTP/dITP diphosphohydrolase